MTDDKDFKQVVRDEARRTGRRYTEVRAEKRPAPVSEAMTPDEVADRFSKVIAAVESRVYGKGDTVRLAALALVVPGNVLLAGVPGNGMTALGQGFAAAIGGRLVSVDGRTGFDRGETAAWRGDDVVVISHFDGLDPAAQVAVVEAGRRPAIVLAKRHPIANRMPFPPDDDTRERFLFGGDLDYGDTETELRIVNEVRDRDGDSSSGPAAAIDLRELHAMRAAAAGVDIPADVRRHAVEAVAATRTDPDILLGASAVATLALVQAAAAGAITSGRARSTVGDVDDMLEPILSHRLVYREGHSPTIRT